MVRTFYYQQWNEDRTDMGSQARKEAITPKET